MYVNIVKALRTFYELCGAERGEDDVLKASHVSRDLDLFMFMLCSLTHDLRFKIGVLKRFDVKFVRD